MEVSVLITTYNIKEYIVQTMESVLSQKMESAFEVLVGDDGSDDGTREILLEYEKKYPDQVKVYSMEREAGREYNRVERSAANRLNLLQKAKGKYCTFLDGDDYYMADNRLQRMVEVLERPENRDCIMCAHNLMMVYPDGSQTPLLRAKRERKISMKQYWKLMFVQSNAILFRNRFHEVPPTEHCARYFDDNNITYWLFQMGKMYYLPECMGAYRQVAGSSWNGIDRLKKAASNMIGYTVELELNPKGRGLSNIRHYPDYAYLFRHRKEIDQKSCDPFYSTAVQHQLTEAIKVYQMKESRGMQYLGFCLRYFTGMCGYGFARLERTLWKITGRY